MMENKRKVPPGDFNKNLRGIFNKNRDPFEIFVFQKWSPGFQNWPPTGPRSRLSEKAGEGRLREQRGRRTHKGFTDDPHKTHKGLVKESPRTNKDSHWLTENSQKDSQWSHKKTQRTHKDPEGLTQAPQAFTKEQQGLTQDSPRIRQAFIKTCAGHAWDSQTVTKDQQEHAKDSQRPRKGSYVLVKQ